MTKKVRHLNKYLNTKGIVRMAERFLEEGTVRVFERDQAFLRQGEGSNLIGYVKEGAFRHLRQGSDGRERIAGYSFTGEFITAFPAFEDEVSAVTIQAMRRSTVHFLPFDEAERHQSWEFCCKIARAALHDVYGKLLMLHTATQEERYVSLVTRVPQILDEVPLREIASFLGMAPETLSRIRKSLSAPPPPSL
jgi:CRP-like cAMP-binding protein